MLIRNASTYLVIPQASYLQTGLYFRSTASSLSEKQAGRTVISPQPTISMALMMFGHLSGLFSSAPAHQPTHQPQAQRQRCFLPCLSPLSVVDGRLRHDWRQHLWRIVYLRSWMGGEHGHDLPANVCRLFLWLPRCGLRAAPTLLPAETHQHLFLSGKPLRTAHSPHWRFLSSFSANSLEQQPVSFWCASFCNSSSSPRTATLCPFFILLAAAVLTLIWLYTRHSGLFLHRAHRCPANALPPVGSRWYALHGGKHAPSRFL